MRACVPGAFCFTHCSVPVFARVQPAPSAMSRRPSPSMSCGASVTLSAVVTPAPSMTFFSHFGAWNQTSSVPLIARMSVQLVAVDVAGRRRRSRRRSRWRSPGRGTSGLATSRNRSVPPKPKAKADPLAAARPAPVSPKPNAQPASAAKSTSPLKRVLVAFMALECKTGTGASGIHEKEKAKGRLECSTA